MFFHNRYIGWFKTPAKYTIEKKLITNTYLNEAEKYQIKLFLDEDELYNAYETGDISKEDLSLALNIKEKLLAEIKENTNKLMQIDYMKYLRDM